MFLGKRKVEYDTHRIQLVPFCKDCDSQEIETIQTCKKCGSHNIGHGGILEDDPRGEKRIIEEKEEPFYKCDYCGKEFNGFKTPNAISYVEGDFEIGSFPNETEYIYTFQKDICSDCLKKVKDKMQKDLTSLLNVYNLEKVADELLNNKSENIKN